MENGVNMCAAQSKRNEYNYVEELHNLEIDAITKDFKVKYDKLNLELQEKMKEVDQKNHDLNDFAKKVIAEKHAKRKLQALKCYYTKKIKKLENSIESESYDTQIKDLQDQINGLAPDPILRLNP